MTMDAGDWNVVILGAWNRAILTPNWIQKQIFGLPEGSPVDVLIALEGSGLTPFQVQDRGLIAIPSNSQLLLQIAEPTEELLTRACEAGQRAIQSLPRTPLSACGINLRFHADAAPEPLLENYRSKSEQVLAEAGREIVIRRRGEAVRFAEGQLNIIVDIPTSGESTVVFNFDRRSSSSEDLLAWLRRPAAEYIAEARTMSELLWERNQDG